MRRVARRRAVVVQWDTAFADAFWLAAEYLRRRPEACLDPVVRANISIFHQLPRAEVEAAVAALRADLASGAWAARHADLLEREELDLGYRLVIAER